MNIPQLNEFQGLIRMAVMYAAAWLITGLATKIRTLTSGEYVRVQTENEVWRVTSQGMTSHIPPFLARREVEMKETVFTKLSKLSLNEATFLSVATLGVAYAYLVTSVFVPTKYVTLSEGIVVGVYTAACVTVTSIAKQRIYRELLRKTK